MLLVIRKVKKNCKSDLLISGLQEINKKTLCTLRENIKNGKFCTLATLREI
jgi:hypothetical protein